MGRLWRLYRKIAEVIWEDCGGYIGKLRRLYGKITEVIREDCGGYMGKPLDPLRPCRPTPGAPGTINPSQGSTCGPF